MTFQRVAVTAFVLCFTSQILASPVQSGITCENPRIRKEWSKNPSKFEVACLLTFYRRSQTDAEKKDYINAVKCLIESPPKTKKYLESIQNRYEDFVAMHLNTTLGGE